MIEQALIARANHWDQVGRGPKVRAMAEKYRALLDKVTQANEEAAA